MSERMAIKKFEVREGTLPGGWYSIIVRRAGETVDIFEKPTMQEAKDAFERAGYEMLKEKGQ